jgi:hypothetical protein
VIEMTTNSSVKCVRDIRDFPPSAYRLPADGRQSKHQCQQRRALAVELATYANGDGSSIKLSVKTLADHLGKSPRAIHDLLDDLSELGLLENKELCGFMKPRERVLNIPAFKTKIAYVQSSTPHVQSSAPTCAILAAPHVQSSNFLPAETPEDCRQPTETNRPTTQPTDLTGLENGGMEEALTQMHLAAPNAQPSETGNDIGDASLAQVEKTWDQWAWDHFMKNLPACLQGAVMKKEQRTPIAGLVKKYGPDCFLAIIARWIERRDLPIEERKVNKWGAMLDEITPHIEPGRKEYKRREREKAEQKLRADWNKLHADIKSRGRLDDAFLESRWSLGPKDKVRLADFKAAPFGFDTFEAGDVLTRYDYWQAECAGTLVWDENVTEALEMVQEEKAA